MRSCGSHIWDLGKARLRLQNFWPCEESLQSIRLNLPSFSGSLPLQNWHRADPEYLLSKFCPTMPKPVVSEPLIGLSALSSWCPLWEGYAYLHFPSDGLPLTSAEKCSETLRLASSAIMRRCCFIWSQGTTKPQAFSKEKQILGFACNKNLD